MIYRLIIFMTLSLLLSCNSEKAKKPEVKKTATTTTKPAVTKKALPKANATKANYWTELQKELQLKKAQVNELKSIQSKTKKDIQALKKNKQLTTKKRKEINKASDAQMAKLLGKELTAKKATFDKKWEAKN